MGKRVYINNGLSWEELLPIIPDLSGYATENYVDTQLTLFDPFPSQTGNAGKYLNTDGYGQLSWQSVDFTNYATKAYADNSASVAAAAVVDSAPAALNTLNELAAALGDDANFATTVTNSLSQKLNISTASSTYLTQSNASTTYLTQSSASTQYEKNIPYSSSTPLSPSSGDMWVDSSTVPPSLKVYNGSSWVQLGAAVDDSQAIISNRVF